MTKLFDKNWHSWDPTPWDHPWLTNQNISNMRSFSQEMHQSLRDSVADIDFKKYKFVFCGNIANNLYSRAIPLRRHGLSIDMVLHPHDSYIMSQPSWETFDGILEDDETNVEVIKEKGIIFPDVKNVYSYPVEFNPRKKKFTTFKLEMRARKFLSYSAAFINTYNAVQTADALLCTQALYFGYLSGRPYLATPSGGDLWYEASRNDELGQLQRASFRNAKILLVSNPWIYAHARRYQFKNLMYLPIILDQDVYSPGVGKSRKVWEEKSSGSFFVLVTARLDDFYKGFSHWLESFVKFSKIIPKARLCVIKWGKDVDLFLKLVKSHGIEDKIIWLPISGKALLRDYLKSADCLIDQFSVGYYGATFLEAIACGLPVIARFKQEQYEAMCDGGAPPVLQSESKEDVVRHLLNLAQFSEVKLKKSKEGRKWFLNNHGSERWMPDYIAVLVALATRKSISFNRSPLQKELSKEEKTYHGEGLKNAPKFPNYF